MGAAAMKLNEITDRLLELRDEEYRDFHSRLMPTVDKDTIIGVRAPKVRQLSAELYKSGQYEEFLSDLPHRYYEENNLHAFIIERIKDYDRVIFELERFLPYVNNWATCDSMSPKILKKHLPELMIKIKQWLRSDKTYTVRFAVDLLMSFYLDEAFEEEQLALVCGIKSDEYYISMMRAWYFATALAKQYDSTIKVIESKTLDKTVHNKSIQKAIESRRITDEQKAYLRGLKM